MVDIEFALLLGSAGVALFAGIIKGVTGFAMPLIMVSGLTLLLEPSLALAGLLLPIVLANLIQTFRQGLGPAVEAVRAYWRYVLMVCIAIAVFAQLVPGLDPQIFYLILGIPITALSLIQLTGLQFRISEASRWWADWALGLVSGIMGGMAGTWGPLTVLYLMALDTPKQRQVVVQGVIYGLGSITLLAAHIKSGILTWQTAPFSALLIVPAMVGLWLGFLVQDRLDQRLFRKVTLAVLTVAGLNLVRRGVLG